MSKNSKQFRGEEIVVRAVVEFVCPFCGGDAVVCEPASVVHSQPACPMFVNLDVVDYLHMVNRTYRATN